MIPPAQPLLIAPLRFARRLRAGLALVGALAVAVVLVFLLVPPARRAALTTLAPGDSDTARGELAKVKTVLDGDTFLLADGRSVRILGIDTPELHNGNMDRPQPFGEEAAARLGALIRRHAVRLESDAEDKDRYGRLLRHVWSDDTLIAETLAREGLAYALTVAPSVRYAERIRQAEGEAKAAGRGVWSLAHPTLPAPDARAPANGSAPGSSSGAEAATDTRAGGDPSVPASATLPCGARVSGAIPSESAGDFVGTFQAVEFKVVQSRDTGKITFLNSRVPFQGAFYVAIFPDLYADFAAPPADFFRGKCVLAQGTIEMYKGSPQLVVHRAEDMRVIDE